MGAKSVMHICSSEGCKVCEVDTATVARLFQEIKDNKLKRAEQMPTEKEALATMFQAYERLTELGFKHCYGGQKGKLYEVIEAGSTGIHTAHYYGEWPSGSWWVHAPSAFAKADLWPSRPMLCREKDKG